MKEKNIGKMKSLLVAILMIASAMFVFVAVEKVKGDGLAQAPAAFSIRFVNWSTYSQAPVTGMEVFGQVNISWGRSWTYGSTAVQYNVTWTTEGALSGFDRSNGVLSGDGGNATWFLWNTTSIADGDYRINVTAYNTSHNNEMHWTNASNGNRKIIVRNTMRKIPGIGGWQGGQQAIAGEVGGKVLSTATSELYYGNENVDVTVRSALSWSGVYYLYRPIYNSSEVNEDYGLEWTRYSTESISSAGSDWVFDDIDLDYAGIWVIDNTPGTIISDADFSNISQFNSTVPGWFWVNTTQNLTIDLGTDTSFAYNSSGTVSYTLKAGEDAYIPPTNSRAVGDIRCKDNGSSIRGANKPLTDGQPSATQVWYKNNSYDTDNTAENYMGFWSVGNYTVHGYVDLDSYSSTDTNGLTSYGLGISANQYAMNTQTNGWQHYNNTWGSNKFRNGSAQWISAATKYNYSFCGPFDPPEKNATIATITVTTGEPVTSIPSVNQTMYFDFAGEVNISVTENPRVTARLSDCNVSIFNELGINVTNQFILVTNLGKTRGNIAWGAAANSGLGILDVSNISKGYIRINHSSWGKDTNGNPGAGVTPFGKNGTWTVMIYQDINGDRSHSGIVNKQWTEEWNASQTFEVTSAAGRLVWTWSDDDGALTTGTSSDGAIRKVPTAGLEHPINVSFSIKNENHKYLGSGVGGATDDGGPTAQANITLSGDALFLEDGAKKLSDFPQGMVSYSGGIWTVALTPVMKEGGGTITITVSWGSFGTHTETLTIGGRSLNGTIVDITPTEFTYGVDQDVTVSVYHPSTGLPLTGATVRLYYIRDDGDLGDMINTTSTPDTAGGNTYTLPILAATAQSAWQLNTSNGWSAQKAPRNITAYVAVTNVGNGYAKVKMNAVKDLKVTVYPTEVMAGKGQAKFHFNTSIIDSNGNNTGRPQRSGLIVRILNSSGGDVTGRIGSFGATELDGVPYMYNLTNDYLREPGIYTVHAYNNTHMSWGTYNATLTVTSVDVTSSLEYFIWGVDSNISATFTLKYKGEIINNTGATDYLRIDNVSKQNSGTTTQYNKSWCNTSFSWGMKAAGADQNSGNNSLQVTRSSGGLVNGVVTINEFSAVTLDEQVSGGMGMQMPSYRYISFDYRASSTASVFANCSGKIKVTIPDVAASPSSIPFNEPARITTTVTGRGVGLSNVNVSLTIPGLSGERSAFTDDNGQATFAFTPPATGNILIEIENRTAPTIIVVTSWVLYVESVTANEGGSFIVTVKNGSATGSGVAGATVTITGVGTETTNANGQATFTAPHVTSDRTYTITATLEGHAEASATLTVVNVPVLTIVYPDEVEGCSTFEVIIADDAGNSIIGATITASDDKTYTSGVNGVATITALSKAGSMTLTASKTGFADSETVTITVKACPGIPGFELLTLIAALGVAFILFRRRRR